MIRQFYLLPLVVDRVPVGDVAHSRVAVTELLAERAVLRMGVTAAVRVVESHVEEERPANRRSLL